MAAPEQNPFITKEVSCPICLLPGRQTRVKRHLYLEQALDLDWRARTYVWKAKGLEHLHPQLYFMWHCAQCCFTTSSQLFEDPTCNTTLTLEQIRAAFVRASREEPVVEKVLALLSTGVVPGGPWDHQQAVRLHLLALYIQGLMARQTDKPDYLSLGRFSLRLAWLWRDLDENPELAAAYSPTLDKITQALAGVWPQIPRDDLAASMQAANYYQDLLDDPHQQEKGWELGELHLMIARVNLQHRRLDPARLHWSKAWDMAQRHEVARKDLETNLYRLRDKLRTAAPALAPGIKRQMEDLNARLLKVDTAGRNLRNKANQVRDLIDDQLAQLNPPDKASGPGGGKKGKRGLFG